MYCRAEGPIPWDAAQLKERIDRLKANGITLGNLMISGFNNAIYARPGRDEEIEKVIQSIRVAGKVGLPVVEYNWYAHRASEGYYEETGRGGSGVTSFDYDRVKDLPPLPEQGCPHGRGDVGQHHLLSESGHPGGGAGGRPAGAAPQRSAGAAQPRLGPDHGHARRAGSGSSKS